MAASIRKDLTFFISKQASLHKNVVTISPSLSSLSLHFFSTKRQTNLDAINPTVHEILVHKHGFPTEFASLVASKLADMKNPERADSMLSFLKSRGFSNAQLQKILRFRPLYLCSSIEGNIKPKLEVLEEEGFSSDHISAMVNSNPAILGSSLENSIIPSLSLLTDLLGSKIEVVKVLRTWPKLRLSNMEATVVPNVEFLKSSGLPMDRVRFMLRNFPFVFCLKPQVLIESVKTAGEMGLTVDSNAFAYAVPTIAPMMNGTWELKLQAFRDLGFSDSDISSMFIRLPRVLAVKTEKLKEITESLVGTRKYDVASIVEYPTSLTYSMEQRYEPRLRILKILQCRNLIEDWPPLQALSKSKNSEFYEKFVAPYLDDLVDVSIPNLK